MKFVSFVLLFACQLLLAAAQYYCPMRCEKTKTYDKPGSCPVCHMDLEAVTGAKLEVLSSLDYRVEVKQDGTKIKFSPKLTKTGAAVKGIQKPHAFIVSQDLATLQSMSLTAEGDSVTGTWQAPHRGNYIAYFSFIPGEGKKQTFPLALKAPGEPKKSVPLKESAKGTSAKIGPASVVLMRTPQKVKPNDRMRLSVRVTSGELDDVDLSPFGISEDTTQLATIHEGTRGEYHATFPKKGLFKVWLPMKIKGGELGWVSVIVRVS